MCILLPKKGSMICPKLTWLHRKRIYIYVIYTYIIHAVYCITPSMWLHIAPTSEVAKNFAERATVAVAQRVNAFYCPCTLTGIFECWECHRGFFPASSSSSPSPFASSCWKKHLIVGHVQFAFFFITFCSGVFAVLGKPAFLLSLSPAGSLDKNSFRVDLERFIPIIQMVLQRSSLNFNGSFSWEYIYIYIIVIKWESKVNPNVLLVGLDSPHVYYE